MPSQNCSDLLCVAGNYVRTGFVVPFLRFPGLEILSEQLSLPYSGTFVLGLK